MDALARIERQYGSVTEYYRSMEEESIRSWEQKQKAAERYAENIRQVEEHRQAGHFQMAEAFCDMEQCHSCSSRTETFQTDEDDDIGVFFCLDVNCIHIANERSKTDESRND